jgi:hypothetical protein
MAFVYAVKYGTFSCDGDDTVCSIFSNKLDALKECKRIADKAKKFHEKQWKEIDARAKFRITKSSSDFKIIRLFPAPRNETARVYVQKYTLDKTSSLTQFL